MNFESFDNFDDELLCFPEIYEITQNNVFENLSQVSESKEIQHDLNEPVEELSWSQVWDDQFVNKVTQHEPVEELSWSQVWDGQLDKEVTQHEEIRLSQVMDDSDNIKKAELDALTDFSWFVLEWQSQLNRIEEYPGEELINQQFNMYGGGNPYYKVLETSEREHKKFKIKIKTIDLSARDAHVENFVEANEACVKFIQQIFKDFIDPIPDNKKIRLYIDHECFNHPINTSFMDKNDMTVGMILSYFEEIVQSLKLDDEFEKNFNYKIRLSIIIADVLSGQGKKTKITKNNMSRPKEYLKIHRSILDISNDDNQCLIRAIIIGKAYADGEKQPYRLNSNNNKEMIRRINIVRKSIKLPNTGCGVNEARVLENYFKYYQIMIIPFNYKTSKTPEYLNNKRQFNKYIYIMHRQNHYYLVRSMKTFLKRSYFCDLCKIGYGSRVKHFCQLLCQMCRSIKCEVEFKVKCPLCKTDCNNQMCLKIHLEQICLKLRTCTYCSQLKTFRHVCGQDAHWCGNCNKSVDSYHYCYMLKEEESESVKDKFKGYIFFDFEAYKGKSNHVVNLAMAQRVCRNCLESDNRCAVCQHVYKFDSIEKFCKWSLKQRNTIQITHNLKGYDGIFIFNYIINNLLPSDTPPTVIINGTKIIQMRFRNIKFLDSHCFIPMALSEFATSFELSELKKGFFPHSFNNPENQSYIGSYPDQKYYEPEFFSLKKKTEFENWYEQVKETEFNFKKEFEEYCWSDVQLLAQGCLKFRAINMQDTKVDPFRVASTIASYCNCVLRKLF